MELNDRQRLESMLAEEADRYLRVRDVGFEAQHEQLRSVCEVLAHLAGCLLRTEEGWNRYYWVDAIRASRVSVVGTCELKVEGSLIWAEHKQRGEWIEPLLVTVRLPPAGKEPIRYEITIGDAARGLKNEPYSMNPGRADRPGVAHWLFRFDEGQ